MQKDKTKPTKLKISKSVEKSAALKPAPQTSHLKTLACKLLSEWFNPRFDDHVKFKQNNLA